MKINLPISLINKYLDTMELNEQVASFYNDYFNYFNDYEFNNEISLYSYIKDNQLDQYFWDKKFINKLFYTTITSPFYEEYLSNNDSYENDKWIWRKIFEKMFEFSYESNV